MKRIILIVLLYIVVTGISAQQYPLYDKHMDPNDSILLSNLPKLPIPDEYINSKGKDLPDYHDNSEHLYFPPIFTQYGWSCGQAASIGYGFTYEINRVRNTSAQLLENQYTPMHTFNFFNEGEDGIGVCYLYTLDAIKHNGNPNVADYGGMGSSLTEWATGYDTYYNGMFNKIENVYALDVGEEEGLQALKYYLYDHLEGSEYGGVVNFYTDLASFTSLPTGTPEEGKIVITEFGPYTGHAMTFIGWNDSIRWDYNEDGDYTNHLDINDDGEVTMKDWEIGGMILANSWGDDWADSGYCYVMYNVLAMEKLDGGIWNKQVNVIEIKENYEPKLTYKIKLTHDSRDKLRVVAGVANDTNKVFPDNTLEFPIFSYQGGDHYMQGTDTTNIFKTIEFGLDVTPLLSYIEPGESAKFFLQVHENDGNHYHTGIIDYFALMDYTAGGLEIVSPETDVPLIENDVTLVSVSHTMNWDKVSIQNEELPAFTSGQVYSHQIEASGGTQPYTWAIAPKYSHANYSEDYPDIQGEEITPPNKNSGFVAQAIEFEFPYYDQLSDTIFMYVDGFLSLKSINYPYPYPIDDMLTFKDERMIAAFLNGDLYISNQNNNGMWYEGDETYAAFRWVATITVAGIWCDMDVSVFLYPDGEINIFVDDYIFPEESKIITGLSNGDGVNFVMAGEPITSHSWTSEKFTFSPLNYPCEADIDDSGLLSFTPIEEDKIYNLSVRVTDDNRISDIRSYQISDGLSYDYIITSGDNNQIDYGETTVLDFFLKNTGNSSLNNLELFIESNDPFINLLDDSQSAGAIEPGNTIELNEAISFDLLQGIPNGHNFQLKIFFSSDEKDWEGRINLVAYAPEVTLGVPRIEDGDNNRLDPGETAHLIIPVTNQGFSEAMNVMGTIAISDTMVSLDPTSGTIQYGNISPGITSFDTLNITAKENAPQGHILDFDVTIQIEPDIEVVDSFDLLIGRYPALIVDLDPDLQSGPYIKFAMEDLDVTHSYTTFLPNELSDFQNLFVVLGRQFENHELSDAEGQRLADFLESGGNIYMEGGVTWYDDPQTAVHPMFNLEAQYLGWKQIDSVFGMEGTFLDNMYFDYLSDAMYYNYHLLPLEASYVIMHASGEDHYFALANPSENYKTVASRLDFGAFIDGPTPSTKNHMLAGILDFFEVEVIISETEDHLIRPTAIDYRCYPNPARGNTTVSFDLEKKQEVSVYLYDIRGNINATVMENVTLPSGKHEVLRDTRSLKPGIYFVSLKTEESVQTIKLVVTE